MRLRIRPADEGDVRALADSLGHRNLFTERLARQRQGRGLMLVAWLAGAPVGSVYLWLEPAEEPEIRERLPGAALIHHLLVHAAYQKRGVGNALMTAAENHLHGLGYRTVALGVDPHNHNAIRMYERLGYVTWPYPPIATTFQMFLRNGERLSIDDLCLVLVKDLGPPSVG
jgi:ribosomal protein S18 acetylase RimI-like enzyme